MERWSRPLEVVVVSFWAGRRVLLTGHTGFKGSWLSLWLLLHRAELHGLALAQELEPNLFESIGFGQQQFDSILSSSSKLPGSLYHNLIDIRDQQGLHGAVAKMQPEIVLHLAAQPLVRQSYVDPLGTWSTNVQGSLNLLEALKPLDHPCAVVMVTTDKVYQNQEWLYGYRETDRLGGHDPYSASKAAAEIAIASWRDSFCGTASHQNPHLAIATARAGNVIGGGDWAADRIVPDAIRALAAQQPIGVRNPSATRPWQHVLEPLSGYLLLAQKLYEQQSAQQLSGSTQPNPYARAFNFGPSAEASRPVHQLIESLLGHWPGSWEDQSDPAAPHEAGLLHLVSDLAQQQLGWKPRWDFDTTLERTVNWYRAVHNGTSPLESCLADLQAYGAASNGH